MFKLYIKTAGAAFAEAPGFEVARILRELAVHVEDMCPRANLRDVNGNRCGEMEWKIDA